MGDGCDEKGHRPPALPNMSRTATGTLAILGYIVSIILLSVASVYHTMHITDRLRTCSPATEAQADALDIVHRRTLWLDYSIAVAQAACAAEVLVSASGWFLSASSRRMIDNDVLPFWSKLVKFTIGLSALVASTVAFAIATFFPWSFVFSVIDGCEEGLMDRAEPLSARLWLATGAIIVSCAWGAHWCLFSVGRFYLARAAHSH